MNVFRSTIMYLYKVSQDSYNNFTKLSDFYLIVDYCLLTKEGTGCFFLIRVFCLTFWGIVYKFVLIV